MKITVKYIENTVEDYHISLTEDPNIQQRPEIVDSDTLEYYWNNYEYCIKCWNPIRTYDQRNTYCRYDKVTLL